MVSKDIRPYEISLWTLQDGFITVLKPLGFGSKGQIEEPQLSLKTDGTQLLTFQLPMYYREDGELKENPIWYSYTDGLLVENLRKLKLIFNKGDKALEKVFEFVITKITETHNSGQFICEVECEGLAFQELGKNGYKLSFSQESFELDYEKWWENEKRKAADEPIASIDYWAKQIFDGTDWSYEVQMDWSSYDGVTDATERKNNSKLRQADKIYEEEYIASWGESNGKLTPTEMVEFREKARIIETDKSNRYNITQTLAETFGVYCKYEYGYDDNYHIISKKCIFYNNFLKEQDGKIDINYPYDGSKIVREKDSTDVITKMYVTSVDSDSSPSGLITIADVSANKSKEDYILNFDYLYSIGTISQEQYDAIDDYELSMHNYNAQLEPIATQIANSQTDLSEYQAQKTIAQQGQAQAKEQMEQANAMINAITGGDGILEKTKDTPYRAVLLQEDGKTTYYVKITQEGVCSDIGIWYDAKTSNGNVRTEYSGASSVKYDEYGNVVGLTGLSLPSDAATKLFYLTFSYRPNLHYENIYNTFAKQLAANEVKEKEANTKIEELENTIASLTSRQETLIAEKQKLISDFENMMGAALREGSWQPDSYADYGEKYQQDIAIGSSTNNNHLSFLWDTENFDGEQLNYYETFGDNGEAVEKNYYICIDLTNKLNRIKNNLTNLSYIFYNGEKQCTIGSQAQFAFLRDKYNNIKSVLLITDETLAGDELTAASSGGDGFIGLITSTVDADGAHTNVETLIAHGDLTYIGGNVSKYAPGGYELVYPRFVVDTLLLKTSEDVFSIKYGDTVTEKYYDYSILDRDDKYYITLKPELVLRDAEINKQLTITYELSNAALAIYLDALEVSKTNAYPQVSYQIDVSAYGEWFMEEAYNMLARIANINDASLKFENVQGYISELTLNLNEPWEDQITIQNYKTKFEDLFSTIVASTESMKTNEFSYNVAASAFASDGSLKQSTLQTSINKINLNYAFDNGNLTIDNSNGIWATSDNGVVAMRGGGIFCANEKDGNGNWIWNTGIMPSGINANLLTAGQIDTNLIRIYAGDNLRFQLNADGLYAFKSDSAAGEADFNNYVVHNSDGLFLTSVNENGNKVNRVEVSWDGLVLRNTNGENVFYADSSTGDLTLKGNIEASSGEIGGWQILEKSLQSKDGSAGMCSTTAVSNGDNKVFWVGNDVFKVESDGTLWATNAFIKGTVSANAYVGGVSGAEVTNAIKKIEIVNLSGSDTFGYYNDNLDGNYTVSSDSLRFRIATNSLDDTDLAPVDSTISTAWTFEYSTSGEDGTWTTIDLSDSNTDFSFDKDFLIFTIKNTFAPLQQKDSNGNLVESIYVRVSKNGRAIGYDVDGFPTETYVDKTYTATLTLRNAEYDVGRTISNISPQSYCFVKGESGYDAATSFSVTLNNVDASEGKWVIGGYEIKESGNNYDNAFDNIVITNKNGISTATIPNECVADGGQIVITYQVDKATRTAFLSKSSNGGSESVNIILRTSDGVSFVNGSGSTQITAELYFGNQIANSGSATYYYLWKKNNVAMSTIRISATESVTRSADKKAIFNYKTIYVSAEDFDKVANYSCYIYTTVDEAIEEYIKNNDETSGATPVFE